MAKAAKAKAQEATEEAVVAYKAFDADLSCRGFKYEIGKTYKHNGNVEICSSGFHACVEPFDVWNYYPPASRYAVIEARGSIKREAGDSKIASAEITIKAELSLPDFIARGVKFILDRVDWKDAKETNTGNQSAATNTGNQSAATNTGKDGVALASGYECKVSGAGGCALFLVERDDNLKIIAAWAGLVGRDGIKPNVFYMLKDGKPVEVGA